MNTLLQPLLVGVDGSPVTAGAIRAAVVEARRLEAVLRLVHVVPDHRALAPVDALVGLDLVSRGPGLLARVAAEVTSAAPDIKVETQLRRGDVATQLAEAGEDAAALYVGRDVTPLEGLVDGNAPTGAGDRSPCPVVSVPADWQPRSGQGEVVVALKAAEGSDELFADAFAEAGTRGDRLVVLHSWWMPDRHDDVVAAGLGPADPTRRAVGVIELLLREWRTSYPGLKVSLRVVRDQPARALVAASRTADLLVLARRTRELADGVLGPTGRVTVGAAECPVRVVPPGDG